MVSRLSSFISKIYTSVLYMRYTNQVSENARLQFHPAVFSEKKTKAAWRGLICSRPGPYYTSVWEFTGALSGTIVGVLAWDSQQWKTVLVGHVIRLDFGRIRNWPNSNGARRRNPRKEAYGWLGSSRGRFGPSSHLWIFNPQRLELSFGWHGVAGVPMICWPILAHLLYVVGIAALSTRHRKRHICSNTVIFLPTREHDQNGAITC